MMGKPLKRGKKEERGEGEVKDEPSFSCLPDEIVLDCLIRVPRRYYENVSCVSPKLRSLVRSPELYRMRRLLHKDPIYICFCEREKYPSDPTTFQWFTLRPAKTTEYELVPIPLPSRFFMFDSASVAVDSEIYFIGGHPEPSELWILNTKSGELRQGPIMRGSRYVSSNAVGVADGKIYVVQELKKGEIGEEVFDLKSGNWEVEGVPDQKLRTRRMMKSNVTLEGKVYAMNYASITTVYNLRQGRRKEKLEMPDKKVWCKCVAVADYLLFACFIKKGLLWLDTKSNVWRVVSGDVQGLGSKLYFSAMAEYYGKLAIFWRERDQGTSTNKVEKIWCEMVALDRVGDEICGTIEWSGVVATIPYACHFLHCLVASD